MKANVRTYTRTHETRSGTCATIERTRICGEKKERKKKIAAIAKPCLMKIQRLSAFMIKLQEQASGEIKRKKEGEEDGYDDVARYIRVKVVCFYVSGRSDRRLSRTYRARSCRALLLHMKSHCVCTQTHIHVHTDNTNAYCAAPGLPAARSRWVLYREGPSGDRFSLSASVATRTSAKRRIILE